MSDTVATTDELKDLAKELVESHVWREDVKGVSVELIDPNPWNPNKQDDRTFEATRESIREFGFIDPVTVRPHPEVEGRYQALDGEHRWMAAPMEGINEIDLVVMHGLTEEQARKLTVAMNMRGEDDVQKLGHLVAEMANLYDGDLAKLRLAMPYSDAELAHLIEIGKTDWDAFANAQATPPRQPRHRKNTRFLEFEEAQAERYDKFVDMLTRERGEEATIEDVVLDVLEAACKAL